MIHSTGQFSFNRSSLDALKVSARVADTANELWQTWTALDYMAANANYGRRRYNAQADRAWADYRAFIDAYMDDAYYVPQQVCVTEYDGAELEASYRQGAL